MNINGEQQDQQDQPASPPPGSSGSEPAAPPPEAMTWVKSLKVVFEGLNKVVGAVTAGMQFLLPEFEVQKKMAKLTREMVPHMEKLATLSKNLPDLLAPITKNFEQIGKITTAVTAPLIRFRNALESMGGAMVDFVGAINPGMVQMFQLAMRDVTAVIGQAFGPALLEVIQAIQEVAALFQPLFAALAPVLGEVYDALTDLLSAYMAMYKPIVELLVPVLSAFGEIVRAITLATMPLIPIFKALFTAIAPIIAGVLSAFQQAIQFFTRGLMMTAAYLMRVFGQKDMAKDMAHAIDPNSEKERQRLQGFAAVQNVGTTDAAAYSKKMLTAVAGAGLGSNTKKSSDEWLEKLAKDLGEIAEGNDTAFDRLKEEILAALDQLGNKIVSALKGQVYDTVKSALGTAGSVAVTTLSPATRLASYALGY